jgi:hypothetical protein
LTVNFSTSSSHKYIRSQFENMTSKLNAKNRICVNIFIFTYPNQDSFVHKPFRRNFQLCNIRSHKAYMSLISISDSVLLCVCLNEIYSCDRFSNFGEFRCKSAVLKNILMLSSTPALRSRILIEKFSPDASS